MSTHVKTLLLFLILQTGTEAQQLPLHDSLPIRADTITFASGSLQLKGLLWKPEGKGPFPALLFNHGSEPSSLRWAHRLAGVFVQRGYAFFIPFRRGQSLSKGQGRYIVEVIDSVRKRVAAEQNDTAGFSAGSAIAIALHQTEQLQDQLAGLDALKGQPGIDTKRLAVGGISFGGIQTMLVAAHPGTGLRCAVNFASAAMMWNSSAEVQQVMKATAARARIPVLFVQAENDFSIEPSRQMAAVMQEKGLPHQVRIYPPNGTTNSNGHMLFATSKVWFDDVFLFLEKYLK